MQKTKERQVGAGGELDGFQEYRNTRPSSDNRPNVTFYENARFFRDESQAVCSCLRAEKSSSILMKAEGPGSDWTRPEMTRLPSRQTPCCSDIEWRGKKMRRTDENVFGLCRYYDGIFSEGLSDT